LPSYDASFFTAWKSPEQANDLKREFLGAHLEVKYSIGTNADRAFTHTQDSSEALGANQ